MTILFEKSSHGRPVKTTSRSLPVETPVMISRAVNILAGVPCVSLGLQWAAWRAVIARLHAPRARSPTEGHRHGTGTTGNHQHCIACFHHSHCKY